MPGVPWRRTFILTLVLFDILFYIHVCPWTIGHEGDELTENRHIGFEELSMRNIDAVLKGNAPITPVNAHLMPKLNH